jgi:hypothetical protein
MKKALLLGVALLLIASVVSAQLPPQGFIGLYVDDAHTTWCIEGTGSFTMYCFVLPTVDGMKCIEIKTVLSSANIAVFSPVYNADVAQPVMGGVPGDLAACFNSCWGEWVQAFSATLFIMAATPESVTMEPFTGSPYLKILDCTGLETEALPLTYVYTNYAECPGNANQESTWGAIKNMYE